MRLLGIMLISLILTSSILVSAEVENIVTGPYKISFDLGVPHSNYTRIIDNPWEVRTFSGDKVIYNISIISNGDPHPKYASVSLIDSKSISGPLTPDLLEALLKLSIIKNNNSDNLEINTRIIDGVPGAIVSYDDRYTRDKVYVAVFNPALDQRHLKCMILSTYPWNEGTLNLLNTVHIGRLI